MICSTKRVGDSRVASAIGRQARLELFFERRRGATVLAHGYAEPPFRIGRVLTLDRAAYLMLVCGGPGIFAGDSLDLRLRVGAGAQVVLTSQSALQVHPSPALSPAHIVHDYTVEAGGELYVHWDPMIPFAEARIEQRFTVRVDESSRLYWSDALMAGRTAHGEAWQFHTVSHELRLEIGSTPAYLERYTLAPHARRISHSRTAGAARYLGTVLIHGPNVCAPHAEALHRRVEAIPEVRGAVDAIEPGLLAGRLAAEAGAPFAAARADLRRSALDVIFARPYLVGRK